MKTFILLLLLLISGFSCQRLDWAKNLGLYTIFDTSLGKIFCLLYEKETPKTVQNFVGLAQGDQKIVRLKNKSVGRETFL